jgi:pyrroloquinoline quinone biosynthesis protein B
VKPILFFLSLLWLSCQPKANTSSVSSTITLTVLGIAQDAGAPHIGCLKSCCKETTIKHKVVSLGLVDPTEGKSWLFEATPDITAQLKALQKTSHFSTQVPDAIILTHAHIGHYTGLMYLGKEALGAKKVPVLCMPRLKSFLENNGPWSQLVNDSNIVARRLKANRDTALSNLVSLTPILVPHRDEYSETAGYIIQGPQKSALFIPDIDKWDKWNQDIREIIREVDYAFIDGTFYNGNELPHRNMQEIPHPFVVESMNRLRELPNTQKNKVYFIHLNHTNPLLNTSSEEAKALREAGYHIAQEGDQFIL